MLAAYALDGLKAGVVAGLAFGLFVALVGNPLVGFADELAHDGEAAIETAGGGAEANHGETGHDHAGEAGGSTHHDAAVPTTVTAVVSVASAALWGVFLGIVVFGAGFYFLEPVIPGTAATKRYVLAAAGFVTVSGAPWLALPPHPPGVEQALPTGTRIAIYAVMMVAAALATGAAWSLYARLQGRVTGVLRASLSLTPYALLPIIAVAAPTNAVATPLPGDLAAAVTGLIVVAQAAFWFVLAAVHAHVHTRADDAAVAREAVHDDAQISAD